MKKIFSFFCLFLLCLMVNISKAQTNQAPTKQDALDFINKILKEYPGTELTDGVGGKETVFPNIIARLDGCNLIFTSTCEFQDSQFDDEDTVHRTKITTINLASVYYTNKISLKSNAPGDISVTIHQETRKPNVFYGNRNGKIKFQFDTPMDERNLQTISVVFPLSRYHMEEPPAFKDNFYDDRFGEAMLFLVKVCGGGRMKTDTNDKF